MTVRELKEQLKKCDDNANVILAFNESDAQYLLGQHGRNSDMSLVKVIKNYMFTKDSDIPVNDSIELFGKILGHKFW